MVAGTDSVASSDTGATANLVGFRWLGRRNRILQRKGLPRVSTYPASARFKFGDRRLGKVHHAADIPVEIAGNKGKITALALEVDLPALLREGASEALGRQLDSSRNISTLRKQGVDIRPRANRMGRYFLSAVTCGRERSGGKRGPAFSASCFEGAFANYALPVKRMTFIFFNPRKPFQLVRRLHWGALWMHVCRTPRRLS